MTHLFSIGWYWTIVLLEIISDGYGSGRYVFLSFAIGLSCMVGYKLHAITWSLHDTAYTKYAHSALSNRHLSTDVDAPNSARNNMDAAMDLFWFKRPGIMLAIIRFVLFESVVEINFVIFYMLQRGWSSCFFDHYNRYRVLGRAAVGVCLLIYSAWFLLPSYTLVVQLAGDHSAVLVPRELQMQLKHLLRRVRFKRARREDPVEGETPEGEGGKAVLPGGPRGSLAETQRRLSTTRKLDPTVGADDVLACWASLKQRIRPNKRPYTTSRTPGQVVVVAEEGSLGRGVVVPLDLDSDTTRVEVKSPASSPPAHLHSEPSSVQVLAHAVFGSGGQMTKEVGEDDLDEEEDEDGVIGDVTYLGKKSRKVMLPPV